MESSGINICNTKREELSPPQDQRIHRKNQNKNHPNPTLERGKDKSTPFPSHPNPYLMTHN